MNISDVQRKSITLKNVLRYRREVADSKEMLRHIDDFLLNRQISKADAYVKIEHGRSSIDDNLLDIELLVPVNASKEDFTDSVFEFLPNYTFEDTVSVYIRGARLYKMALSRLSAYMKVNNLKPVSGVCHRYYSDTDMHDLAVELFVSVEENIMPRDSGVKLTAREKEACFDRAVRLLEGKLSQEELCEGIYGLELEDIDDGIVSLTVENDLLLDIVRKKYKSMIEDAFRTVLKTPVAVYLTVEEEYEDEEIPEFRSGKIEGTLTYEENPEELDGLMDRIGKILSKELSQSVYEEYILPLRINTYSKDFISFDCPKDIYLDLEEKYRQIITYVCEEVCLEEDMMVVFMFDFDEVVSVGNDGFFDEDEDDFYVYDGKETKKIFERAKNFIRTNVAHTVYDEYIECLICGYVDNEGSVQLWVEDDKAYVIPVIEERYKSLVEKAFRYALGGIDADIEIGTVSEIPEIDKDRIMAGFKELEERIDTMREKISEFLDEAEDEDYDYLCFSDEETQSIFDRAKEYIRPNLGPIAYDEYIGMLSCRLITKDGYVSLYVADNKEFAIPLIEDKYKSLIEKGFRYALGGIDVSVHIGTERINFAKAMKAYGEITDEDSGKITLAELFADYINDEGDENDRS